MSSADILIKGAYDMDCDMTEIGRRSVPTVLLYLQDFQKPIGSGLVG